MTSHRSTLAKYAGMSASHFYTTLPIGRLLDTAGREISEARTCWRCGGRGWMGKSLYGICPCCDGIGIVVQYRVAI